MGDWMKWGSDMASYARNSAATVTTMVAGTAFAASSSAVSKSNRWARWLTMMADTAEAPRGTVSRRLMNYAVKEPRPRRRGAGGCVYVDPHLLALSPPRHKPSASSRLATSRRRPPRAPRPPPPNPPPPHWWTPARFALQDARDHSARDQAAEVLRVRQPRRQGRGVNVREKAKQLVELLGPEERGLRSPRRARRRRASRTSTRACLLPIWDSPAATGGGRGSGRTIHKDG